MKLDQTALEVLKFVRARQAVQEGQRAARKRFPAAFAKLRKAHKRKQQFEALATWLE